ncbi:MAG: hypothetical protein WC218_00380 [Candidatus Cloacimonadales bacterium]
MKDEANQFRLMYYAEINLSWGKVLKTMELEYNENNLEIFANALSSHLKYLKNPKFQYHSKDRPHGFTENHQVFSEKYLSDIVLYLLKPTDLTNNPSLEFGYQSFNYNMHFKRNSFSNILLQNTLKFETSVPVYALNMKMHIQYKPIAKKSFNRDSFRFPLMVFMIFKNFSKSEYSLVELVKQQLNNSNPNAFFVIICESVDKNAINQFMINIKESLIFKNTADSKYIINIITEFHNKMYNFFKEKQIDFNEYLKNGYFKDDMTSKSKTYNKKKYTNKNYNRRNNEQSAN